MTRAPQRYDAIVVGLGAMGSAAAWQLAHRGARVLGLEQFDIPHAFGSSHGHTRMIRLAYHEHPDYVPLLLRALESWRDLERRSSRTLFHQVGGVYIGPSDAGIAQDSLRSAQQHHLPHALLDAGELISRFPALRVPPGWIGLFEPQAGALLCEEILAAQVELALQAGARLLAREPVIDWMADEGRVTVRTAHGEYHGDQLILCAGAWSHRWLKSRGVALRVTRQVMGWFSPPDPALFSPPQLPCWAVQNDDGTLDYGIPVLPGHPGAKIARHRPGIEVDPAQVDRRVAKSDRDEICDVISRRTFQTDSQLLALRVCLYELSPDQHFIIDSGNRSPTLLPPRVTLAAGFSGHGFKFASIVGEVLADLSLTGRTGWPIEFLGLQRFAASPR